MVIQTPILTGSKEIARYVGRPWNTVRKWIACEGFPARKKDGRWMSEKGKIVVWMRGRIEG
jgi:hypothetical protein